MPHHHPRHLHPHRPLHLIPPRNENLQKRIIHRQQRPIRHPQPPIAASHRVDPQETLACDERDEGVVRGGEPGVAGDGEVCAEPALAAEDGEAEGGAVEGGGGEEEIDGDVCEGDFVG